MWHGRDDQTGAALCGTGVPATVEVVAALPAEVVEEALANVFESRLCAACARMVKLHRG